MAEYVKLLNGRYITNALVSIAERRERKHVEFGLYGVNLLNKEVAKSSNLVVKLRILHHVLSPKHSQWPRTVSSDQCCFLLQNL